MIIFVTKSSIMPLHFKFHEDEHISFLSLRFFVIIVSYIFCYLT